MRKFKFDIGIDFILLIAALYCIDTKNILILGILAAAIHEIGHILAIWICGGYIDRIQVGVFGANIELSSYPIMNYKKELFIAASGPLLGLVTAIVFAHIGGEVFYLLAGFNLILSIFNLLPAYPLDGGRILRDLGHLFLCDELVYKICLVGNILSAIIMISLCLFINVKIGFSICMTAFSIFIALNMVRNARYTI